MLEAERHMRSGGGYTPRKFAIQSSAPSVSVSTKCILVVSTSSHHLPDLRGSLMDFDTNSHIKMVGFQGSVKSALL